MNKLSSLFITLLLLVGMTVPASGAGAPTRAEPANVVAPQVVLKPSPDNPGKHRAKSARKGNKKPSPRPHHRRPHANTHNNHSKPSTGHVVPRRPVVNLTVKCGPLTIPAGQGRVICVTIEQPTETRVIYRTVTRTKTQTEKVLQGAGVIALVAVGAGLLALFLGYVLGWRGAGRNEKKFLSSLLNDKE